MKRKKYLYEDDVLHASVILLFFFALLESAIATVIAPFAILFNIYPAMLLFAGTTATISSLLIWLLIEKSPILYYIPLILASIWIVSLITINCILISQLPIMIAVIAVSLIGAWVITKDVVFV